MASPRSKAANSRAAIRFVMGGTVRELRDVDPNRTVLDWLRTAVGRTGTKEGCAEGDCGACSVVLGELDGSSLRYRAVNACILFMPALDGKQLVTVEDLKRPDGTLHPVQQAMVDCHGSQCGFCTPGFVMSLFALFRTNGEPGRQEIDDALAGNLCRCTGYRPIIDAAREMYRAGTDDQFAADEAKTVKLLRGLRRKEMLALEHKGHRWFAPTTVEELAKLRQRHPEACIVAGGTDAGLWVTKQHRDLETILYTGNVAALKRVRVTAKAIEIGAAVTCSDAMGVIAGAYPAFGELLRRFGSVQIRNSATLGGNVANGSPIGDSMPALIALGASVVLRKGGARREIALEDLYLGYRQTAMRPGEFVEAVRLPKPSAAASFGAYKISKRFDQDISAVCGAFGLVRDGDRVRDIRICYGGMAATPKRAASCEAALRGETWSEDTVATAARALAQDFSPISDMRASGRYRELVARNLLRRFWLETSGDHAPGTLALHGRDGT